MHSLRWFLVAFLAALPAAPGTTPAPAASLDPVVLAVLEKAARRGLEAYNAASLSGLRGEFARSAPGLATDDALRRVFFDYYRADLGRLLEARVEPRGTVADRDRGVLAMAASFEKAPRVLIEVCFTREEGALKIAQLRFERIETAE